MLKDAIEFYYRAAELKDMLRQGAVVWNVNKDRYESIAEHTYGCIILSIALCSELSIDVNLGRVIEMLAIHEFEELAIGDVTPLSHINKDELKNEARLAVTEMLKNLNFKDELLSLTDEFNLAKTSDAKFAKAVDKLECVLEFKKYQDKGQVSLSHLKPDMLENKILKEYVVSGKYDLADIFFLYHMPAYESFGIDENFWFSTLKPLKLN